MAASQGSPQNKPADTAKADWQQPGYWRLLTSFVSVHAAAASQAQRQSWSSSRGRRARTQRRCTGAKLAKAVGIYQTLNMFNGVEQEQQQICHYVLFRRPLRTR
jgi:hypothetical protein